MRREMRPGHSTLIEQQAGDWPLVSIIVVTYNHEAYIDECIGSCVAQTEHYPNLEVIVADDGSSDGTPERIRDWANRYPDIVKPVIASKNAGIAANFNQGIAASRGPLIAWLGGDDIMIGRKIRRQVEFLACNPNASGCYHDADVFAWPGGHSLGLFSELYAGKAATCDAVDAARMLDPRYQMLPSTVMVRRSALPKAYDLRLRFHNDYLFDLETIIAHGPYVRMEGVLTRYRKHEKSIGVDPVTRKTMLEENLIVCAIAEARYPALAAPISRRAVYYLTLEAVRSAKAGDRQRTRSLCRAIWVRGCWFRASMLWLFGGPLSVMVDPKYRRLAIRLRSILG